MIETFVMPSVNTVAALLGGLGIFLLGTTLAGESFERLGAQFMQKLFQHIQNRVWAGFGVGIILTLILQSSGVVTSLLVALGSARVIQLESVMGVILGTAVGSTFTVQFLAFSLFNESLLVLAVAAIMWLVTKRPAVRQFLMAVMGICLLFIGLGFVNQAAIHLSQQPLFRDSIREHFQSPQWNFLLSAVFCGFIHSSAATVGLTMGLVQSGLISLDAATFWVLGANVGTTSTALIAASGGNAIARQVAWAHFLFKSASVAIFMIPWLRQGLLELTTWLSYNPQQSIALFHLGFNLLAALFFMPWTRWGASWVRRLIPDDNSDQITTAFLNWNHYNNPALALSFAQREAQRLGDIVLSMLRDSIHLFEHFDMNLVESIRARDKQVDFLYREIKMFLVDYGQKRTGGIEKNVLELITFLADLERAADAIDINIVQLAIKKNNLKLSFSQEGANEIRQMWEATLKTATLGVHSYFQKNLCSKAIEEKRRLAQLEKQLRENHIRRLQQGLIETINTSSIHLDLLNEFRRIGSITCIHAYNYCPT